MVKKGALCNSGVLSCEDDADSAEEYELGDSTLFGCCSQTESFEFQSRSHCVGSGRYGV